MSKSQVVTISTYDGRPVIGDAKPLPYNVKYLKQNRELLEHMSARHNKLMMIRADLRYPEDYEGIPDNRDFSETLRTVTRKWSREGLDPAYGARREQRDSEHPHLHLDIAINAALRQRYKPLLDDLAEGWARQLGRSIEEGKKLVWPCDKAKNGTSQKNGIILRRGSEDFEHCYDEAHRQMSYLAKDDPDDVTPSGTRKVFYSQYKRKDSRPKR